MPQQLIYTSAPRGLVAGRSGYCTVARSASMREALMLRLEQLSYYQHHSLSGGRDRPIYAYRIVDIRGTRFHVLSKIQDAGLDFTGRTNFIAHHLVVTPEEISQLPTPPVILRYWQGWTNTWKKEPQLLEREDWSSLKALGSIINVPAETWQKVTGDSMNGYGLLEGRAGSSFRVDDQTDETILKLLAESVELLEVRDARRDFRTAAWQYTFTTSMQDQDSPSDFRWRCIHSDNPAAEKLAGPDCRPLSSVRANRCTDEETVFARSGRQPPKFVVQPQNIEITEGESACFQAKAEGTPNPSYEWFEVDRANTGKIIEGATGAELQLSNPPLGLSRYMVRVSNSAGEATSEVAVLSVEQKVKIPKGRSPAGLSRSAKPDVHKKSESDIEKQRKRLEVEKAEEMFHKKKLKTRLLFLLSAAAVVTVIGVIVCRNFDVAKLLSDLKTGSPQHGTNEKQTPLADQQASTGQVGGGQDAKKQTVDNDTNKSIQRPSMASDGLEEVPPQWKQIQIGAAMGSVKKSGKAFIMTGVGSNITNDFFFVCQTNAYQTNHVQLITSLRRSDFKKSPSRGGLMMRNSAGTNAPFVFLGCSKDNVQLLVFSGLTNKIYKTYPWGTNEMALLSLEYTNNQIVGMWRFDKKNPDSIGTHNDSIQNWLIGIAVCSGTSAKDQNTQITFDDLLHSEGIKKQ